MKIGIMTFHRAANYGAVLQAYALQTFLRMQKQEAYIIDYRCRAIEKVHSPVAFLYVPGIANKFKQIIRIPVKLKKRILFNQFINKKLLLTKEAVSDVYIAGSDQIWNNVLTENDYRYFLPDDFFAGIKISYAASFGIDRIDKGAEETYRKLLSSFDMISVRERSASKIVKQLGRRAEETLDPVFLLSNSSWADFSCYKRRSKYLLLYMIENAPGLEKQALDFAKQKGLELVHISDTLQRKREEIYIPFPTPEEWVGLIQCAEYVCTNSFHGTAFSIIFHKNATIGLSERRQNGNSRIIDLLRMLEMDFPREAIYIQMGDNINWERIELLLSEKKKKSIDFLLRGIREK